MNEDYKVDGNIYESINFDIDDPSINPYEEYNSRFDASLGDVLIKQIVDPIILEKNECLNKENSLKDVEVVKITNETVNPLLKQVKALLLVTQKQRMELNKKRKVNMVYYM